MMLRFTEHRLFYTVTFTLAVFIFTNIFTSAQVLRPVCASEAYQSWLTQQYPGYDRSNQEFERWMTDKIRARKNLSAENSQVTIIRTIPIIFHVLHDPGQPIGSGNNISAAQIHSQIDVLNEDFRKLGNGFNEHPDGVDTDIEFCPALVDDLGNILAEPGIMRWSAFGDGPFEIDEVETIKPATIQDPSRFLNYWIADLGANLLGYAQFPNMSGLPGIDHNNGPPETDGVVVTPWATGTLRTATEPFDQGRTATHEIGHWLGLMHIWGSGFSGCGNDDNCEDTPLCDGDFYSLFPSCGSEVQCGFTRMIENYMDYSDDGCMNIFTNDQKARMDVVLENSPSRPYSEEVPTLCHLENIALIANSPQSIRSCGSTNIAFQVLSDLTLSSVEWNFSGAGVSPDYSILAAPDVQVSSTGTLTAELTAILGPIQETKIKQISVIILEANDSVCLEPTCSDGVKNGDESGIDCGGSCPQECNAQCDEFVVHNGPMLLTENTLAGKVIEAGNLTGSGEVTLSHPDQIVLFQAGETVVLQSGFIVPGDVSFEVQIAGCPED
jgi:hypothetical protein